MNLYQLVKRQLKLLQKSPRFGEAISQTPYFPVDNERKHTNSSRYFP